MKVKVIKGDSTKLKVGDEYMVGLISRLKCENTNYYWIQLDNGEITGFESNSFQEISGQSGMWRPYTFTPYQNEQYTFTLKGDDCLAEVEYTLIRLRNGESPTRKLFETSVRRLMQELQ